MRSTWSGGRAVMKHIRPRQPDLPAKSLIDGVRVACQRPWKTANRGPRERPLMAMRSARFPFAEEVSGRVSSSIPAPTQQALRKIRASSFAPNAPMPASPRPSPGCCAADLVVDAPPARNAPLRSTPAFILQASGSSCPRPRPRQRLTGFCTTPTSAKPMGTPSD